MKVEPVDGPRRKIGELDPLAPGEVRQVVGEPRLDCVSLRSGALARERRDRRRSLGAAARTAGEAAASAARSEARAVARMVAGFWGGRPRKRAAPAHPENLSSTLKGSRGPSDNPFAVLPYVARVTGRANRTGANHGTRKR